MVDINRKQAENMLNSFCAALDDAGCKYQADREALSIRISFKGDDFDLAYNIRFDEERQIIRFRSDMPFGANRPRRRMSHSPCAMPTISSPWATSTTTT